jgi:FKBP-type peptidyl-prolyl cis-trans isomerase FkpA
MKFIKPTLIALALVATVGCQESKKEEAPAVKLETEIQKQSYGLGASIGMYMQRNLEEHEKLGLALEQKLIVQGFVDALANKSQLNREEIQTLLVNLDKTMKTKREEAAKAESDKNLKAGQEFLAENAKKEGVKVTESGIQYEVLKEGTGAHPKATDTVKVHYKGTFINGDVFDSSYDRNEPAVFPLDRVIKGWTEGVQLMTVGSKYRFVLPADMAYGPVGSPPRIPGNSVLVFEVELLDIEQPEQPVTTGDKQ